MGLLIIRLYQNETKIAMYNYIVKACLVCDGHLSIESLISDDVHVHDVGGDRIFNSDHR